jgi:glycosyltransferase involved in cell wall biosynthesis
VTGHGSARRGAEYRPVVHVSPTRFGAEGIVGGGERYPLALATAMARLTPTVLVTFGERAWQGWIDGLRVRVLPGRHRYRGGEVNPLSARLPAVLCRARVVHLHQWESVVTNLGVLTCALTGVPVFATDHGGYGRNHWRRLRLDRLVTGFLPVSEFGARWYPELADRATVLLGGVDTTRFAPPVPAARPRHGAVVVARLLPHKGIDVLLRAVGRDLPVHVVGRPYSAGYRDELHRLARDRPVTFDERADDAAVVRAYQGAQVAVLPSVSLPSGAPPAGKSELLGLSLLEAMACGTPVVCTDVGGMAEVVGPERGRVVPPADPAALAAAVRHYTELDPSAWRAASGAARAWVCAHATWDAVAGRCLAAYRRPAPGRPPAAGPAPAGRIPAARLPARPLPTGQVPTGQVPTGQVPTGPGGRHPDPTTRGRSE